jgi:hypothetical protein
MYRIDKRPAFWTPVKVFAPGGAEELGTFRAQFRALPISELEGYDLREAEGTAALLKDVTLDLDEIEHEDGSQKAFSPELLEKLLDANHLRQALLTAYLAAMAGARTGN